MIGSMSLRRSASSRPWRGGRLRAGRVMASRRAAARRARPRISFEDMAARRAERLVNLVICLLSTRQFLTAERIRDAVPGYEAGRRQPRPPTRRSSGCSNATRRNCATSASRSRPAATAIFDAEDGYRIKRGDYELPPIEFDAAEAAAVGLAGRLWRSATLGEPARNALIKLRAARHRRRRPTTRPAPCPIWTPATRACPR